MDNALGYPKAGRDVGPGIHAPAEQSVTVAYVRIVEHPTLPQWAVAADAQVAQGAGGAAPVALDASWFVVPTLEQGLGDKGFPLNGNET